MTRPSPNTRVRPNTRAGAIALAGGLVLAAGACGSAPTRVSDPPPDRAAYPVVAVGQAGSVLAAVQTAVGRGVTAADRPSTVDARLLGPYRELDLAQARIAARQKKKAATPARMTAIRLIVPTALGWPRFFVSVAGSSESSTPILRVLTSASARSPYGLWAEPAMLPGATLPDTALDTVGSATVGPDAAGLVASPKEVLSEFARYLSAGARTTSSTPFARSIYSDQLIQVLKTERTKLKSVATLTSVHKVGSTAPMAVRTADGGALVIGQFEQTSVLKVKKGKGHVNFTDQDLAALAGGAKQIKTSFTRTAVEVLVFAVPPSGKGLITVIAAQKGDVSAVAR